MIHFPRLRAFLLFWFNRLCPVTAPAETAEVAAQFARKHAAPPWSMADDAKERELYLAGRAAFWLRPDRHEHGMPCWMIEGPWEEPRARGALPPTVTIMDAHRWGIGTDAYYSLLNAQPRSSDADLENALAHARLQQQYASGLQQLQAAQGLMGYGVSHQSSNDFANVANWGHHFAAKHGR